MPETKVATRRASALAKREALLEAGTRCIEKLGLRTATMDDFAAEAGVSRITLYREFGNREEFVDGVHVLRFRRFNARFGAQLRGDEPLGEVLERYFVETAQWVKDHQITQQFTRQPIDYTEPGTAMHAATLEFWGPMLDRAGHTGRDRAAQWILVMQATVSRLSGDGGASVETIRELVRRFVLPAFG